jgi:DNA-binding CsgD family transcriptional regulator
MQVARTLVDEAIAEGRHSQHALVLILGLAVDGWLKLLTGDTESALTSGSESVAIALASDESRAFQGLAMSVNGLAMQLGGDLGGALTALTEAVQLVQGSELPRWVGFPLMLLAGAQLDSGDLEGAVRSAGEADAAARAAGYPWIIGRVEQIRGRLLSESGDHDQAESHFHRAFLLHQEAGDVLGWCDSLAHLANSCIARGHPDVAVRLWSAVQAQRIVLGCITTDSEKEEPTRIKTSARGVTDQDFDRYWEEGRRLDLNQATAYVARNRGKRGRPTAGWDSLTSAELEVVGLVALHLSNPELANQLFVSRATVKTHLVHIFTKLGVSSRSQLAAEALRSQLA